jgi:hypothetical protein
MIMFSQAAVEWRSALPFCLAMSPATRFDSGFTGAKVVDDRTLDLPRAAFHRLHARRRGEADDELGYTLTRHFDHAAERDGCAAIATTSDLRLHLAHLRGEGGVGELPLTSPTT